MNELALFAGAGGGILGGKLLGWRCVCAVEVEEYPRRVLLQRQDDGLLDPFPVWDDVRTFDGRPWRGVVDVVSGGFPCQDISAAGKGAGLAGARSGLWFDMARVVAEVRPRYVWVENSPLLVSRGLDRVLSDLAALGYDAVWGVVGAHHAGAPHKRDRVWVLGHAVRDRREASDGRRPLPDQQRNSEGAQPQRQHLAARSGRASSVADAELAGPQGTTGTGLPGTGRAPVQPTSSREDLPDSDDRRPGRGQQQPEGGEGTGGLADGAWWSTEPDVGRVAHGVAARVDRLKAIGNGQVPAVVALAFRILHARLSDSEP